MKYKHIKYNLISFFTHLFTYGEKRFYYRNFLRTADSAPAAEKEIRTLFNSNYRLLQQYGTQYKIISLGWNCMPRSLTTTSMLKPGKGAGEKSLPFDLVITPPAVTAQLLETDFSAYFDGEWIFDPAEGCWVRSPETGILYPHDTDCGPEDLEKLQTRLRKRIENFREAVRFPGPVLFILNKATQFRGKPTGHTAADVEAVCRAIKKIRGENPYKILVTCCDPEDPGEPSDGAETVCHPYPRADYVWHHAERFTPEGVRFELGYIRLCRKALVELLKQSGVMR